MKTEFEARFTDINLDALRAKLKEAGGVLVYPERLQRRVNMDYPDKRLALTESGWIRLRDEGEGEITLTYKRRTNNAVNAALETSVSVASYDDAKAFLLSIGLVVKSEQETKRERWMLGDAEIDLDTWPWLKPCVEIEGKDEASVVAAATQLGFDMKEATFGPINFVYQQVYGIEDQESVSHTPLFFNGNCPWRAK